MSVKRKQNLAEIDRGLHYKAERLEEFLDSKGAFYNGNESDNDNDSYNENNEQQQLPEGFANGCYKIVSPILLQKPILPSPSTRSTAAEHFYLLKMWATVLETRTTYFKKERHFQGRSNTPSNQAFEGVHLLQ